MRIHTPGIELNMAFSNPLAEPLLTAMGILKTVNGRQMLVSNMYIPRLELSVSVRHPESSLLHDPVTYRLDGGIQETSLRGDELSFLTNWHHLNERGQEI